MKKLTVNLENCYGINKLDHNFNFSNNNNIFIIYAPNGSMKTSFAKSFKAFHERETPTSFAQDASVIKHNISGISADNILVVESYDSTYKPKQLETLLVNQNIKKQHERIINDINSKQESLINELSKKSGLKKDDVTKQFLQDNLTKLEFLKYLSHLQSTLDAKEESTIGHLKYSSIFNDETANLFNNNDFLNQLNIYINQYNELISNSTFFKSGVFDHNNADKVIKSLKDNGFFRADHKVFLNGKLEIVTDEELSKRINEDKDKIINDPKLQETFNKINKLLEGNATKRKFRDYVKENPIILTNLNNIPLFKKQLWEDYLYDLKTFYQDLIDSYTENQNKLSDIREKAKKENTKWQEVIDIFNRRFHVPFVLDIENKDDAVLGTQIPIVVCKFKDKKTNQETLVNEILSQGEKRALYLLNVIFDIETRKKNQQETLFIIDDIADSFDYQNKYAIIEYLRDISSVNHFYQIILTHNYDFYRTLGKRLLTGLKYDEKKEYRLQYVKQNDTITLRPDKYQNNPFDAWKKNLNDDLFLIAFIPFARNLSEYLHGVKDNTSYNQLTELLHIKTNTNNITKNDLVQELNKIFSKKLDVEKINNLNNKVLDTIYDVANKILSDNSDCIELEHKIVLSIAIRLKTEEFLINKINNKQITDNITSNQTFNLIDKYKKNNTTIDNNILSILDRVTLITSENIHINSFMYEPILDMSSKNLKDLYNDVINNLK